MTAATATATSQQLWTSGGALVQRAQEPNIPFGESLTSMNPARGAVGGMGPVPAARPPEGPWGGARPGRPSARGAVGGVGVLLRIPKMSYNL